MGSFFSLGKSSNDTQENPKDALKKEEELKEVREENAKLNRDKNDLAREKDKLADQNKTLIETNQNLAAEKEKLERESKNLAAEKENLTKDKENLTNQLNASQKQAKELEQSQQVLKNEKAELLRENKNLTTEKENLTTALSTAKSQAEKTSQKLKELEQRHAPYQKLEKLYEVFLEVKDRLNFNFVATTHSAMDLIAHVLSDSKYYLENLYNKASQELSDKRSDKGEKLAELFDLLFEYIKDSKFERLKEPSAYDHSCKTLYPEQNASQKMQRVVLRGYKHNDKVYYTIVDMGS
ncbi:hypothetical protein ECC49_00045 [Helicobacter pylori]|uniref:hypothetical protein n=1 Tax=Helicobacter pylori TaxID=210 RepID=UPI000FDDEE49|nr:hypothetical protein [Helicobacter pylori]RVY77082.1 hypothetical protein ECC49_00045 [Helicobacter pylori]